MSTKTRLAPLAGVARDALALVRPPRQATIAGVPLMMSARIKRSQMHDDRDYPALRELSRDARCIYDIGGLYGVTALLMAKTAVDARLWSFDASERSCELIALNATLNGVSDRVRTVCAVLSDRTGDVIPFFADAMLSGTGSMVAGYLGQEHAINRVTLATDDFAAQSDTHPDFVKIDVEGAERQVLVGMSRILREDKPNVLIETHSWEGVTLAENVATILPVLASVNYELWFLEQRAVIVDPSVVCHRGRIHALAMPRGRDLPKAVADLDLSGV